MKDLKLVHNDGRVPSIIFPKGKIKEGGTCQFASEECLYWCVCTTKPNYIEKEIYKYFKENTAINIATKIHMELIDRNRLFLQWFAWGDCPKQMTLKIKWIILKLHSLGVTQCGFTRNKVLWESLMDNIWERGEDFTFAYTVEDIKEVEALCRDEYFPANGLIAHPKYDEGKTYLYRGMKKGKFHEGGTCSGHWYEKTDELNLEKTKIYEASCDVCHDNKRGCFK